jgi:acetoin utilization protein AcuC
MVTVRWIERIRTPAVMSDRVALVWDEGLVAYDLGPEHPLKPVRVKLTVELSRSYGLLDRPNVTIAKPRPATREELEYVHLPNYIDAVKRIAHSSSGPYGPFGWGLGTGDNPVVPQLHEASALIAGASMVGAEMIHRGDAEHVFTPAGGLHHAMPDRAAGFCVYNDPAIAIRWLLKQGHERIAYVDVDVHHGDGVQEAFFSDPRVLTISLHETGEYLFPGTGFPDEIGAGDAVGTKVNVALPPYTGDDAYREAFERIVPPLVESWKPSVLVTQLGCDTHATDPLAHLALITPTYRFLAKAFHELAHGVTGGRWLATGGGGYQIYRVVPRAWTIYFAEIAGTEIGPEIPQEWIEIARDHGATDLPDSLEDPPVEGEPLERARPAAQAAAEATARAVFGHHGLR